MDHCYLLHHEYLLLICNASDKLALINQVSPTGANKPKYSNKVQINEYDIQTGAIDPKKKRTIHKMKEGAFGNLCPNKLVEDKLAGHAADYLKRVIEAKFTQKRSFVEIMNSELVPNGGVGHTEILKLFG